MPLPVHERIQLAIPPSFTPESSLLAVDGLLTGLREPRSSHLLMLGELRGPGSLRGCYDAAVAHRYLWHEFGDVHPPSP